MDPLLGQIVLFAGNFAPRGWALCEGQLLAISQNTALFSILGTTYGGDGRTTFALPDLRGRSPIGTGTGPGLSTIQLGSRSGSETKVLTQNEMPNHTHTNSLKVSSANASQSEPTAGSTIAKPGVTSGRTYTATDGFNTATPDVTLNTNSITTVPTGGGQQFNIRNPYLGVNYIIALQGIFPSRN